ncbi:fungal-specific transcription factor domain-containing protein [Fusarium tricinctum]|uniref:Fungal-specific transcription factor domain-containing protein n=1 Tax=Fusarium tricinctum TaxID=61284 RepID=A0A8K0WI69_9HYPO|nr:fungal-specific transcription factor domain-containing protein [Fusarium tricinctum]
MHTKTETSKSGCRRTSKTKNASNPRSRSGCVTCKAKHTKCDETRPECLRCTRKGVKCGGYWKEFKWSFKHQPGDIDVNLTTGTSPTASRRGSTVQSETPYAATSSAMFDTIALDPTPGPSQNEELPIEDAASILGDAAWTTSSCTDTDDLFARSNSIVDTSDTSNMTVSNMEITSTALTPTMEPQFFEGTPLTVGLITDTSSLLISNWFEQVCSLWSGFDSDSNLNRKLALELCTSSQSVFSSLQSMSAGFLSTRLPHMRQSAMYFLQAATGAVLSEAENALQIPGDTMPSSALFSLFCLGTTVCWVDARQLGLPFFRSARKILDRLNRRIETLSAKDLELLSFFNRSLTYCEMLLAAVNRDDESLDTEDPVTGPQTDSSMQLAERYMDNSPHPWTGISPLASQLFAQSIRLCRSFRRNLKLPKETGRDFQRALEEIQEAQRLEERLLGLDFQNSICVDNTGDYRTPPHHLTQIAEAYKLAALLQLYQTFPDLVALRLPSNSVHANSRHIPWEEWIIPLSLRLVNVLEQIPPNSGTRVIQPLLYITASSGLRYDMTTLLDISSSSFDASIVPSSFQSDPFSSMETLATSPPPANLISRLSLDISNARHFITGRLNMLENSLPPKPVVMAKELIKAIWEAYDNESPGSALVHWVDVMEEKNLRSMFG